MKRSNSTANVEVKYMSSVIPPNSFHNKCCEITRHNDNRRDVYNMCIKELEAQRDKCTEVIRRLNVIEELKKETGCPYQDTLNICRLVVEMQELRKIL